VGRALKRALGPEFVLPDVEPREAGTSLLMNPRRQRVFEYTWNHPCAHLRRMSRELRIPPQSLRWHLLRLTHEGLLASRTVKGKTVYFAPWALRDEDVPLFASLSNGMRGRIVRLDNIAFTGTRVPCYRIENAIDHADPEVGTARWHRRLGRPGIRGRIVRLDRGDLSAPVIAAD